MTGSRDRTDGGGAAPLVVRQPRTGYRYSIDSLLLAAYAAPLCGAPALDIGTGSGVILLLLAAMRPGLRRGVGAEIQPRLLDFARRNIEENGFAGRLFAVPWDFREETGALGSERFDLVVSNPPYRRAGDGRRSPDPEKETARREVAGTLPELVRAAAARLVPGGRFATLCLPERLPELLGCASAAAIGPQSLRFVHPFREAPANVVLFAGDFRRAPGLAVLPPLVVHESKGVYSGEVRGIFGALPVLASPEPRVGPDPSRR